MEELDVKWGGGGEALLPGCSKSLQERGRGWEIVCLLGSWVWL